MGRVNDPSVGDRPAPDPRGTTQGERSSVLRSYGGVDGDERVSRRREALIDSALGLLDTEGAVTVRGVCRASGLNPRYFYESFESADALVEATFDQVIEEISDSALTAFAAGIGIDDKVSGAVGAIVDVIDDDRRKGSLLFSPSLLSPVLAAKRSESSSLFAMLTLHAASDALDAEAGPRAIAAAQFQVGGLGRLLSTWLDGEIPLDRDEVVELSVGLMMSLVQVVTRSVATEPGEDMLDS
ncbi:MULTISPECIES: TetR/AcrR family transcriptional regulator [unclassified Gordonia (in: high G+C Gram-positive bacteria)]